MEKFSAFRDPGTGIQPFLTPVPPVGSNALASALLPFGYIAGIVRTTAIAVLALLYMILVKGILILLSPIPPLHRMLSRIITAILGRLVLLVLGIWWIPVEVVTRKKGRNTKGSETWKPKAGDIIVSNWTSWIELLWLVFRFDPLFVLPICSPVDTEKATPRNSNPITVTPGRRTGTGSAAISSPIARTPVPRSKILGFTEGSLLTIISATGATPFTPNEYPTYTSLESIRSKANRPIVVFPECTTSNGRGLLHFSDIFPNIQVPVDKFQVFVMCVKYDPPTSLSPTLSHSIPSATLNPLSHIFKLTTSLIPLTVSIRLLAPSESPSCATFLPSDHVSGLRSNDVLTECCASLIAQVGKMKRVSFGWEDKVAFMEFYKGKKR
ncbi:hypothetical protein BDY19DRAFT_927391 [Irpex rosettiformis]|uniref:Uncharacterized protein n=1 Tax=Irpex rosettiformis TaxID=378272 RepID=A0ACB8UCX7_9APHY|nr:hypothetical protein BDY19DRAFT_927391 [Irpex rosettiformis]